MELSCGREEKRVFGKVAAWKSSSRDRGRVFSPPPQRGISISPIRIIDSLDSIQIGSRLPRIFPSSTLTLTSATGPGPGNPLNFINATSHRLLHHIPLHHGFSPLSSDATSLGSQVRAFAPTRRCHRCLTRMVDCPRLRDPSTRRKNDACGKGRPNDSA